MDPEIPNRHGGDPCIKQIIAWVSWWSREVNKVIVCLYFFIRSSLTKQPQVKQQYKIGIYKMSTYITYIKDMHEHMNTYAHI